MEKKNRISSLKEKKKKKNEAPCNEPTDTTCATPTRAPIEWCISHVLSHCVSAISSLQMWGAKRKWRKKSRIWHLLCARKFSVWKYAWEYLRRKTKTTDYKFIHTNAAYASCSISFHECRQRLASQWRSIVYKWVQSDALRAQNAHTHISSLKRTKSNKTS